MIEVIIADDGKEIRDILKQILTEISGVQVIGEAENGCQLVKMVREMKPDLVFVDVDMPEMNGTKAAKEIFEFDPNIFIVFATGYEDYAYEAFKVYAFDYILKPFKVDRINQTIKRVIEWKDEIRRLHLIERMASQMDKKNMKLKIKSSQSCIIVNTQDIIFITRSERRTLIYTTQGIIKTYEPIEKLYGRLKGDNFFRCHKGYIINADMVIEYLPWGHKTYVVKLANTKETALMTLEKAKEFQKKYCFE